MGVQERAPDWTAPGAWTVAPGVHRVPLPLPTDGLRAVNVYVLEQPYGLALVDGGWAVAGASAALDRALRSLGYRSADVGRVLVTHIHRDHYTHAVVLRRQHGARISLGAGERESLAVLHDPAAPETHADYLQQAGAAGLAAWWHRTIGARVRDLSLWEAPDEWLVGGGRVDLGDRVLDVVATPGHTRGHVVFVDLADGLMFAGDHVLPTITPSIGFEPLPSALPLSDYLTSLAKVRALPDLVLLPAHGAAGGSVHARVDELLAHHRERLLSCRAAVADGCVTAFEVAGELAWTGRNRPFRTLDDYNSALAVLETRAHLEVLVARGDLVREPPDPAGDVVSYRVVVVPGGSEDRHGVRR